MKTLVTLVLLCAACGADAPPGVRVTSTSEVGVVPQSAAIVGHDGASSALLFGHSVWAYGDTVLSLPDEAGQNWHSNSFAVTDDLNAEDGLDGFTERVDAAGAPVPLIANTDEEATFNAAHDGDPCATSPCGARWAIWPGHAVFDADRQRALLFYGLIYAEPGAYNFHGVGQSIALWTDYASLPQRPTFSPGAAHPTLLWDEGEPSYGAAAVIDGSWLYAFACAGAETLQSRCTVARAALDAPLARDAFTYWDGAAWTPNLAAAHPVFEGGSSLTVVPVAGHWLAVYGALLSNDIMARTAAALTGPWSGEVRLVTADRKGDSGWTYDAYVHRELSRDDGRTLFLTFTRPTAGNLFASETALVRITLATAW